MSLRLSLPLAAARPAASKLTLASVLSLASLALAACGGGASAAAPGPLSPSSVDAAKARWPDATAEQLEKGHQLYVAKCAQCHSYPAPADHAEAAWPAIMERMGKQAKLDDAGREQVLRFVLASRPSAAAPAR